MNHRERWLRTMHYQPVDHVPDEEFGYWDDTLRLWHKQGLPEHVRDNGAADRYFGFAPRGGVPAHLGLIPAFQPRIIEETDRHRIQVDSSGVKSIVHKDGSSSIPKYLEFPIKTRADWESFKERLNPDEPKRHLSDEEWSRLKQRWANRDYPLGVGCGSLFGWIRDWMGFESASIACAEDPDWVEEMMEHITNLVVRVIERPLREVQVDFAAFWEDMCFNKGPIISPRMFKQMMVPRYKRITDLLKRHGVDVVYVDCDGNINELVELWLEGGVNCMFPMEVRAGSDPVAIRRRFGKSVLMMGGVNKLRLAEGPAAIRAEIRRIEPVVEEGGYIPHVDHRVPPDVSYQDYLYYLRVKREAFGIPEPPHYEERVAAG